MALSALPAAGAAKPIGLARRGPVWLRRGARSVLLVALDSAGQSAVSTCESRRLEASVYPVARSRPRFVRATQTVSLDPPRCGRFFDPAGVWNAALPADAPQDPDSAAITADFVRQVEQGFRTGAPPWINTTKYSAPIYTVRRDEPTHRVTLDYPHVPELQRAWDAVPIPSGARAAAGTDQQLVVWQPSTDTLWEFWRLSSRNDGWHASWGGRMVGVSQSPGFFAAPTANWGATATSLPLVGGLMTIAELQRGRIDHALAVAVPEARAGQFAWPAQRTDGRATYQHSIPEGARFRLDPSLNIDALNLPPIVRMIADAAQRYGLIVRDRAGSVVFYGEDPGPTGSDPYPALFGGASPAALLRTFPWQRLRLVQMQLSSVPRGSSASCGAFVLACSS